MKNLFTKLTFTLVLMVGLCAFAIGQRTISGVITDADNNDPLIGANVLIKGTGTGTITDIDGSYSLSVPDGTEALVISYTGYVDQVIVLGSSNSVNIALAQGAILDEVVVVGYGAVKKRDLTGSVASLKEEDFNKGLVVSADQLIQGRVPGVSVVANSGQPGGQATVKIRGNNSIRAGAEPLYVVDNVPLDGRTAQASLLQSDIGSIANSNPLNFINPSDIASVEILKDASSAAIYGARGSNGVILITTKKGRKGEPSISFNTSVGFSSILKKYDVLSADEYRSALNTYGLNGDGGGSVDAFDAITRTGTTQNYNLSIGTGGENSNIRFSAGYQDIEGIVKESGIKRYNGTLNSQFNFLDGKAGVDVLMIGSHTAEDISPISSNAGFTGNLVGQALQWNPTIPLLDAEGNFVTGQNNPTNAIVGETTINPLNLLDAHDERAKVTTILGSISPYFKLTDNLTYRYRLGVNYGIGTTRGNIAGNVNVQGLEGLGLSGIAENTLSTQLHTHTLDYNTPITDAISMTALVGYEYQKFDFSGFALASRGFSELDFDNTYALQNGLSENREMVSFADPLSELQSYFGRVNFNISDKYLLTATVRADGSSKFGENNKYGIFPSLAAAWNITDEDFLADNDNITSLKLRAGWGVTGNQEFPAGSAVDRYGLLPNNAVNQENVGNPDLKWESSSTINVGLDFALWDYKLSGNIDYYSRVTNDLLLDPFVREPGPAVRAWQNIDGEVANSGLELGLSSVIINNDNLTFDIGANVSFLTNEFRNFNGKILTGDLFGQGSTESFTQRHISGQPLNTFVVQDFTGLEGGLSSYANDGELVMAGDPNADVILGFTTGLGVGDFNFSMNWNGAFGHQLYNNTAMSVIPIGNLGNRNVDAALITSDMENTSNAIAASTRYIESGDFLKLSNATLSYNIGDLGTLKDVRLSLTGNNLLVITDYSGFDPEVNTVNLRNGVPSSGIEYIPYPSARTILFGINVSL